MCDGYCCIFYLIPTKVALKKLKYQFYYTGILNKVASPVSFERHNLVTTSWLYAMFSRTKHRGNDQSGPQRFLYNNVMQIIRAHFKYFQVQTHVQTAQESPDLNMDLFI